MRRARRKNDVITCASVPTIQGNCIDEFDKMESQDQVAIHEAMEQQTISITKAGIQANLNARTSILAAANPKHGRYDRTKTLKANVDMTAPIMSRFDLFFVVIDDCDELIDRSVAAHIVDSHRGLRRALEAPFTLHQLQTYIRAARRQAPTISDAANRRLVACYRALRQNDVIGRGKTAYRITVRQLESMIRLAEAHARLHFQTHVEVANVVEAFRLLKKSIISVETEGVMLEDEEEEDEIEAIASGVEEAARELEAVRPPHASAVQQNGATALEENGGQRPAELNNLEDSTHLEEDRGNAVDAIAEEEPEISSHENKRAAKRPKREKIKLSYEDYKRYEHDLTTRLRRRAEVDGVAGISRSELIESYIRAHHDAIGDDTGRIAEHARLLKQIIKRLLKDEAIIIVPEDSDEQVLAIHPNYTPHNDSAAL